MIRNGQKSSLRSPPQNTNKPTYRDTSAKAAESLDKDTLSRQRGRVFSHIKSTGGATCWETEEALGMLHQTASSHIRMLSKAGELIDTGKRQLTGSGRMAIVWGVAQ
jgi:hypothetical protein